MSLVQPLPCEDDFNIADGKRTSGSMTNVAEFVDPQYTVKQYGTTQLGYLTPETSPTDTTPRRGSFASSYYCGSSAASSFMSHSGNVTPSLATPGSSASNSRRQSMLLPECQQYYLSAASSSLSDGPQDLQKAAAPDQCLLQESSSAPYLASTNAASLISDDATACVTDGGVFMEDDFMGRAPRQWQSFSSQTASSSLQRTLQAAQIDQSTDWSCDLVPKLNSPIAARGSHAFEFSQPLYSHTQPSIFENTPSQPERSLYNPEINPDLNTPLLEPAFEYGGVKSDTDLENVDNSLRDVFPGPPVSDIFSHSSDNDVERGQVLPRIAKNHIKRRKGSQGAACDLVSYTREGKNKSHRCREPTCDYACNRQEHLRRHESCKHMENIEMHPCAFDGCKDRKTGKHRHILARLDNLKAHYTKTHFNYGSSENGGKNDRKSMKAAHEMGLSMYDHRWTLLLRKKMNVNEEIKDNHGRCCYLHVWKMLGYSILETKDIKIKDVVPDWPCPGDETLQEYDPRWRALWNGTLTFDKAMSTGRHMGESEAQGLLGVTMLETEAMGIKHLDPRWTVLLSGRMGLEQSEKLGVKQRNPKWKDSVARRRARCCL